MEVGMAKFVLDLHSIVDIITNSSSELFVSDKDEVVVREFISTVYPDYLSEYEDIKETSELSTAELSMFFDYEYGSWQGDKVVLDGFTYDEMYHDEKYGDYSYAVLRPEFVRDKLPAIIGKKYFLFSLSDNPNWEMQEQLMLFMTRYHLG